MVVKKKRKKKEASIREVLRKRGMSTGMQVIVVAIFLILVLISITLMFNINWRRIVANLEASLGFVTAESIAKVFTPAQLEKYLEEYPENAPQVASGAQLEIENYKKKYPERCSSAGLGQMEAIIKKYSSLDPANLEKAGIREEHWNLAGCYFELGSYDASLKTFQTYKEVYCITGGVKYCGIVDDKIEEVKERLGLVKGIEPKVELAEDEDYKELIEYVYNAVSNPEYYPYAEGKANDLIKKYEEKTELNPKEKELLAAVYYWKGHILLKKKDISPNERNDAFNFFNKIKTTYSTYNFPPGSGYGTRKRDSSQKILMWVYRDEVEYYVGAKDIDTAQKLIKNIERNMEEGSAYQDLFATFRDEEKTPCESLSEKTKLDTAGFNTCIKRHNPLGSSVIPELKCFAYDEGADEFDDTFKCASCYRFKEILRTDDCDAYRRAFDDATWRAPWKHITQGDDDEYAEEVCDLDPCRLNCDWQITKGCVPKL